MRPVMHPPIAEDSEGEVSSASDRFSNTDSFAQASGGSSLGQLENNSMAESTSFHENSDYDSDEDRDGFSTSMDGNNSEDEGEESTVVSVPSSVGTSQSQSTVNHTIFTDANGEIHEFAEEESKFAQWGRNSMCAVLLVLAIVLPWVLYRVANEQELDNFQDEFKVYGEALGMAWQRRVERAFLALDSIAVNIVRTTPAQDWPLVTCPDFHIWGIHARNQPFTVHSNSFIPIVTEGWRADYEAYIANHSSWVYDAEQWYDDFEPSVGGGDTRRDLTGLSEDMANEIFDVVEESRIVSTGPGPFSPIRQIDPVNRQSLSYNLENNSYWEADFKVSAETTTAVMGRILESDHDAAVLVELLSTDVQETDLYGIMTYPVMQALTANGGEGPTVALLSSFVSWASLFRNVVPSHAVGIDCVVENTCGQTYTLAVNGENVELKGPGDLHDSEFSNDGEDFSMETLSLNSSSTFRIHFNDEGVCQYRLSVYPTEATKSALTTDKPKTYAVIAAVIFGATLIVVAVYDYMIEKRRQAMIKAAIEARAIVSSLFPAKFRDPLFETEREKAKKRKKQKKLERKRKRKLKKQLAKERRARRRGSAQEGQSGAPKMDDEEQGTATPGSAAVEAPKPLLSPGTVENIMNAVVPPFGGENAGKRHHGLSHPKQQLKGLLEKEPSARFEEKKSDEIGLGKPIADLFPHTTVLFADIVGFTAWSSEREPEQVFTLLQTIYHAFDKSARRRGVFKVETIGDCYMAVTGLPEPQEDHAVRMTKFGRECMTKMADVTKKLEVALGPDTGDLCMRIGLNSGPVTAGVLQGEKSRFQLFGDTVNTASRMESTGEMNRIQVSKSTADLLIKAGKTYWVKPREELIHAKGKGQVQTYWIVSRAGDPGFAPARRSNSNKGAPPRTSSALVVRGPSRGVARTTSDSLAKVGPTSSMNRKNKEAMEKREERLVQWQVDLFLRLLKNIVAAREVEAKKSRKNEGWDSIPKASSHTPAKVNRTYSGSPERAPAVLDRFSIVSGIPSSLPLAEASMLMPMRRPSNQSMQLSHSSMGSFLGDDKCVIDEVAEVITLPRFNPQAIKALDEALLVEIDKVVVDQLKDYVTTISHMYRQNPFHNFEHASHVTMSANKLLNRIVIPEHVNYEQEHKDIASDLHDYTYGITSDPLTQFSVIFSALVHDVDHTGVPNGQLAKENIEMAAVYRNQSVAEQNSVDLAWDLFMEPKYKQLQDCIAANDDERARFRQLVVNSVLATDIFDKQMKELRNKRWDKAFHRDVESFHDSTVSVETDRNMRATIVIEHIIQASDVAHTMQHWHIYQKWNEKLFAEMYSAFECGRAEKNPADGWYKGELWFFDNYVIPLAKKLAECRVFGVASDECLNYAQANRSEWSVKGEEVVEKMLKNCSQQSFFVAGLAKKGQPNKRPPRMTRDELRKKHADEESTSSA